MSCHQMIDMIEKMKKITTKKPNKKISTVTPSIPNVTPTYPFMRLDMPYLPEGKRMLSFKQFIEAWKPLIQSGPNSPKTQYSKLPVSNVKPKPVNVTQKGTYGHNITGRPEDSVKAMIGKETEKNRLARKNLDNLKSAGGLGKYLTKEETTLKTRADQYNSAKRKFDKTYNRQLVRATQFAQKEGTPTKHIRKVIDKFSKNRDIEDHSGAKDPRSKRLGKYAATMGRKARALRRSTTDELKKTAKIPGYKPLREGFRLKAKHKNPKGGLNSAGRSAYNRATGSNLKPPAPHPKSKKDAGRRKSFCARMSGMKRKLTSSKTANDPNSRINKSLRAWNC